MSEQSKKSNRFENLPFPEPGDEVVISGIAGRFPESDNLAHFQENLFNKVDLITDDDRRWKLGNPDIPHRTGKINNVEKFDAEFFGVSSEMAQSMDPMARLLLEHAYEAIIDAGVNPRQLHGTNTGVFIACCFSESETFLMYSKNEAQKYGTIGCMRSLYASRISRWLGTTGPSFNIDSACSSSLLAIDQAFRAIRSGQCEDALVGAANLCLFPNTSLEFALLGVLSPEGICRSFDNDGNGYCRSEAISMIYLQKSKDAKRIYANVIYSKTNCDGFKDEGITFPSSKMQCTLLQQFYEECGVPPSSLDFLEAHATGTIVGDPIEMDAIEKVFCPGRTTPLKIGSIKSNLGHTEPSSGLCSIAKIIIAMESGYIPPNLHYKRPREGIKSLEDGRIQVVTEPTPWNGGYVGVSSFGFGGLNVHILLKSYSKEKVNNGAPNDDLSRLVGVSGRTENAVTTLLDHLESRPVDVEYVSLLHNIHSEEIEGHSYRGYTILPPQGSPKTKIRDVQLYSGVKRPVWFVFSGMGSQWAGIGKALLKVPTFAKTIELCDSALRPHGVDIFDIFTNEDPKIFENIVNSFIGIAAVQIGLVELLASIGIAPDNIIGYSLGELGCAYADGCLTAEQVVLIAYFQGLASIETDAIEHSADHKGLESSPITSPADSRQNFFAKLQANNMLARERPRSKTEYYSRYIGTVRSKLLSSLQMIILDPKPRSEKWLSTSDPRDECKTSWDQLCSPEYLTNNLLSPVLFEEKFDLIPNDAIAIEIAPLGLLEQIWQKSAKKRITSIALTTNENGNHMETLLRAIGMMYEVGLHPQLTNLFPTVQHPVSRGTPMISPLIRWNHSDNWFLACEIWEKIDSGSRVVEVSVLNQDSEWMAGHIIDGRNLVPATGYLVLVWETMALMQGERCAELSIVFEDVRFHRATTIPKQSTVELTIMIQKGSGRFEVSEGETAVVTGFIRTVTNPARERASVNSSKDNDEPMDLTEKDIYKELRLRGYQYTGIFRGLKRASLDGTRGRIAWNRNWAAFMDNMLQMKILGLDTRGLFVPTGIQKLVIDCRMHADQLRTMPDNDKEFSVENDKNLDIIASGGVEIRGLKASAIARRKPAGDPVLEDFKFIAHRDRNEMELRAITRIATHIALENHVGVEVKTIELVEDTADESLEHLTSPLIQGILGDLPLLRADVNIIAPVNTFPAEAIPPTIKVSEPTKLATETEALLVIGHGILANKNDKTLKQLLTVTKNSGFLLAREPLNADADIFSTLQSECLDVILEKRTDKELILLLRKRLELFKTITVIQIKNDDFTWLPVLQAALKMEHKKPSTGTRILLVSEGDFESGLMGLVNCLRREPGGQAIQGMLIQDLQAPKFSLENPLYSEQLKLGLAFNVLRPSQTWGSYRFSVMDSLASKPVHHTRLSHIVRGDLSTLKWVEGMIQPDTQNRNLVKVYYSSVNFRDIMLATGKLAAEIVAKSRRTQENVIGFEYSGRDVNGRAVMGMIGTGAMSNYCICDPEFIWPVPDHWTLEDAATVPATYATAIFALIMSAGMKKEDKVLIHAGSGGVGQAAITLALHEGCEVFTTVGTRQKREFIKTRFPQIDDDHIGNSRDTSFEQWIQRRTHGRGVDIVLNCLAEEKLQASIRCLARGGRFLEIGKFDLSANNPLGLEAFLKGISFYGILLDSLFAGSSIRKTQVMKILTESLNSGAVKPLTRTIFPGDQVEAAFRYMAAGKHIGKVILKIRDEHEVLQPAVFRGFPRYYCLEDSTYLILGGLGGFGLELADWLVLRGAKKLVLTSRKGIVTGYQRLRVTIWESYGTEVVIIVGKDASRYEDCEDILKEATALGPVDAIFNLAVVLKDGLFENQTVEAFEESLRVKAWATKQLDILSRTLCPHLRQFVVFSSVSCGRGNAGQTNYGMANSIMERICEKRAAENLPALAIQWGAVGDVGLVAEMQEDHKEVVIGGTLQQKILSCLHEMDSFLRQDSPVVSSMVVAEKAAGAAGATNIINAVINIMGLKDLKTISLHTPLTELGMDSMMAVEIKQTLERDFEVFLTADDIRALNFLKLQEMSQKQAAQKENHDSGVTNENKSLDGIKLLIRTLGTDHTNKDICVPLVQRTNDEEDEIFILPGIEGTHSVFLPLTHKLKSPTTCLQLGTNFIGLTSIHDMADYLVPHVKARSKGRKGFVVAGYSFGSIVAIELVRRLESEGLNGRLVLIDGSPDHMKAMLNEHLIENSDNELQSILLLGVMSMVAPSINAELARQLQNCNTWDEKLTTFTKHVPEDKNLNFTLEDQRAMCTSTYLRLKAIRTYDPSPLPPLRTPITLLKPKIPTVRSIADDYGLGLISRAKINIHYVEGDHVTMLDDHVCAAAINGELLENTTCTPKEA